MVNLLRHSWFFRSVSHPGVMGWKWKGDRLSASTVIFSINKENSSSWITEPPSDHWVWLKLLRLKTHLQWHASSSKAMPTPTEVTAPNSVFPYESWGHFHSSHHKYIREIPCYSKRKINIEIFPLSINIYVQHYFQCKHMGIIEIVMEEYISKITKKLLMKRWRDTFLVSSDLSANKTNTEGPERLGKIKYAEELFHVIITLI